MQLTSTHRTPSARSCAKDAERYRWLRDLLAVEDVARLVDEHAQWSWCETDPAESAKTDTAVDKAMAAKGCWCCITFELRARDERRKNESSSSDQLGPG